MSIKNCTIMARSERTMRLSFSVTNARLHQVSSELNFRYCEAHRGNMRHAMSAKESIPALRAQPSAQRKRTRLPAMSRKQLTAPMNAI